MPQLQYIEKKGKSQVWYLTSVFFEYILRGTNIFTGEQGMKDIIVARIGGVDVGYWDDFIFEFFDKIIQTAREKFAVPLLELHVHSDTFDNWFNHISSGLCFVMYRNMTVLRDEGTITHEKRERYRIFNEPT